MLELIVYVLLASGPYVSVKGGVSHLENHELHFEEHTYDKGYGLSGSMGYDFGWLRSEIEVLHTANIRSTVYNLDRTFKRQGKETIRKTFYFLNGFLDLPVYERVEGYVGAGYGFPRWQLMGGLKYHLTDHWMLDLGYRFVHEPYAARSYTGPQCARFQGSICSGPEAIYENHLILFGLTYNF